MKKNLKIIAVGTTVLIIFLAATNPADLPTVALVIPFIGMFVLLTLLLAVVFSWNKGEVRGKSLRMGALAASLPMLLLVLRSMGQLTIRDTLMLFALFGIVYFYISKSRSAARQ